MKKILVVLIILYSNMIANAQYGNTVSQYTYPYNEFILNYSALQFDDLEVARKHWASESRSLHSILRVGFFIKGKTNTESPVNDVRLVTTNGIINCSSTIMFGCNDY